MTDEDLCVSCPICMGKYSATRYPIVAPNCGHSLCIECGKKRNSNECVLCLGTSFRALDGVMKAWPSDQWNKNFTLLELINLRSDEHAKNGIDFVKCSGCKTMEKRERMKICGTCTTEWNNEWEKMKEEEMHLFLLCAFCCQKEHENHGVCKFPWKLNQLLNSTVADDLTTVSSMEEMCSHEFGCGKEKLKEWEEKMNAFRSIDCGTYEYEDGLSIANTLKHESDVITQMSESCLPPLRKFRKAVMDSSARLDQFKKEIEGGKLKLEHSPNAKLSEADIMKAEFEKKIQVLEQKNREMEQKNIELDQKKEEEKKKIMEDMRQAFNKALTSTVHVSRLTIKNALTLNWPMASTGIDRLLISVSHTMYLCAVDMYKARFGPDYGTAAPSEVFSVFESETSLGSFTFNVLKGENKDTTLKVSFTDAIRLSPNKQYRLELKVDKPTKMYYGEEGTSNMAVPGYPGHVVTFANHPDKSPGLTHHSTTTWGQFAGFHFRIGK